jgi:hypothetical protein
MDPEVLRRAGVCCVNVGDFASGLKYLEEAERLGVARSELALPMAFASMKLKNFIRAKLLLKEAEKNSSPDMDKINQVRDLLESEALRSGSPVYRSDFSGLCPRSGTLGLLPKPQLSAEV